MSWIKKHKTSERVLLNLHKELCEVALNKDIKVNIDLQFDDEVSLNIVFFKDGANFSFTLYQFYDEAKNKKFFELSKDLIKDRNLFDEYSKIKTYE